MKKRIALTSTILVCLPAFLCITIAFSKSPFGVGKCTTPIVKEIKKAQKPKGPYDLIEDQGEEEQLTEAGLLQRIENITKYAFHLDASNVSVATNPVGQTQFLQWVNLLSCIYEWLEKNNKKAYLNDITQLYTISDFIAVVARNLHSKSLTDAEKEYLKEAVEQKIEKLIAINKNAVFALEKSTNNSSTWKGKIGTTSALKPIIEQYSKHLTNYNNAKKTAKNYTEEDFFADILSEATISDLKNHLNNLEQMAYRLQLTKSFDIFNLSHQLALSKFGQKFMSYILNQYGNGLYFISEGFKDKVRMSKDLEASVIIYISTRLFMALTALQDALTPHWKKATPTKTNR